MVCIKKKHISNAPWLLSMEQKPWLSVLFVCPAPQQRGECKRMCNLVLEKPPWPSDCTMQALKMPSSVTSLLPRPCDYNRFSFHVSSG